MDPLDVLAANLARFEADLADLRAEIKHERRRVRVLEAALAHFARGQAPIPETMPRRMIDDQGRSVRVKAVA